MDETLAQKWDKPQLKHTFIQLRNCVILDRRYNPKAQIHPWKIDKLELLITIKGYK